MRAHLDLHQEEYDNLAVVFSGGNVIATPDKFVESCMHQAEQMVVIFTQKRYDASVSGAMRWPWSSEFAFRFDPPRGA